jgi:ADP-ribose pyrophosphatase YjhB (NUDIX family)
VLIFVWHRQHYDRRTRNSNSNNDDEEETITVVREYMPSQDAFAYGLAAGMVDSTDHGDFESTARRELAEECGCHVRRRARQVLHDENDRLPRHQSDARGR